MATSKIQRQYVTKDFSGSTTISGNNVAAVQGDFALSGYTPIGIIRVQKSGTNASYVSITRFHLSATQWIIGLYNNRSDEITCTVSITVLYEKA